MSAKARRNNFIVQGSLLALAGIIVRVIGMVYRVPLTAIIGTEGNGYYTSAYSIYSLLLILSSYSMPTAISRIVSHNNAVRNFKNTDRLLRTAFTYSTVVGFIMFCTLWFGADYIADMLEKPYCSFALRTLAPTVWIMAYLGILRGYFQGSGNMIPTAISQILEQIFNAFVSVMAASILFSRGEVANTLYNETQYSYAYGAAGGAMGTGAGALVAFIFFLVLFRAERPRFKRRLRRDKHQATSYLTISAILGATMLPILLSSTIYNISSVLDDYLFGNIMARLGNTRDIVNQWGVYGEYHILFNIPVALSNSLSSSLIPSLTRAVEEGNRRETVSRIRYSIRFTMLIAIPSAVGLFVLATPICKMLFPGDSVDLLISLLRVGSLSVVLYSLSTISNAILQGLGKLNIPLKNALVSLVCHILILIFLLYSGLEVYAVVIANIVFALIMCMLNQMSIRRYVRYRQQINKTYIKPLIASACMGISAFSVYKVLEMILGEMSEGRIGAAICTSPAVIVGVVVYFFSLIMMRSFTREDLDNMPMGGRLKRFVR